MAKHVSLERAERWPAGARRWEVTRTQRVRRYVVGRMGEADVVGVEGVCGVSARDFEVRAVGDSAVVCYVVKRVAFGHWVGMKKVSRECQGRMAQWRERAMEQVQLQAQGAGGVGPLPPHSHSSVAPSLPPTLLSPPAPPAVVMEEEKVQTSPAVTSPSSPVLPPLNPTRPTPTPSRRPQGGGGGGRGAGEGGVESVAARRRRLKEEEMARVRKGRGRYEEYWMDRVMTIEKMQEEKMRRRGKQGGGGGVGGGGGGKRRGRGGGEGKMEEGAGIGEEVELPLMGEGKEEREGRRRRDGESVMGTVLGVWGCC